MPADKLCVYRAVLDQINHPRGFTSTMLRAQTAYYIARQSFHFERYLHEFLLDANMTLESYINNVFTGHIWCDRIIIGAISMMFNVPITVLSPTYAQPWKVFHNTAHPGIILIANGGDMESTCPMSHISSTGSNLFNNTKKGASSNIFHNKTKLKYYQDVYVYRK